MSDPVETMRTFFHPAPAIAECPLIVSSLNQAKATTRKVANRLAPFARKHPKVTFLLILGAVTSLFSAFGLSGESMPGVAKSERKNLPSAVEEAAREVFDHRFVQYGDSHYTIAVHYFPNAMSKFDKIQGFSAKGSVKTKAPLIACMELIEIKNLRTGVHPGKLLKSDQLNGVTWKGELHVSGEAERRRILDLNDWVKAIADKKEHPRLPWIEASLTAEAYHRDVKDPKPENLLDAMGSVFKIFGVDSSEQLAELVKGEAWRDWAECGNAVYQSSQVELRGEKTTAHTSESIEEAIDADREVTWCGLYSTNYAQMISNGEGAKCFLTKPDIKALRKASLLE